MTTVTAAEEVLPPAEAPPPSDVTVPPVEIDGAPPVLGYMPPIAALPPTVPAVPPLGPDCPAVPVPPSLEPPAEPGGGLRLFPELEQPTAEISEIISVSCASRRDTWSLQLIKG